MHLKGLGWLPKVILHQRVKQTFGKNLCYLTKPVVKSRTGVIVAPFSSAALDISIVAMR